MSEHEGATRQLAVFAAGVRYETLPARVKELLPVLLIDLFRAGAVGRRQTWTAKATQVLLAASGVPTAAIMYSAVRADPVRAAYLNGVITGSLDWDDSHIAAIIHPGIIIWPAIFAAAEVTGANGIAMAEAAAAGYETAIRIGMSVQPDHALRGFQGTPTCGVFGGAVAAGRLLGLDETGLQNALGIAASYSSGLSQFFVSGSDVKRLHAGKAAAAGVEIALLVKAGLTGPADAIEGAQGFGRAVSDSFAPDIITKDLDRHYWLEAIALKVHGGTVRLQAAIEAAELLARGGIKPGDIERIEIGVPKILMGKLTWNAPVDQQQAQMSAPFAVAMTFFLVEARPGPLIVGIDDFGEMVHRNEVRELAARTNCVVDDEIDQRMTKEYVPARVTAFLKDGEAKTAKVMLPKGCQQNPITETEVYERFHMMVRDYMSSEQAEAWLVKAKNFQRLNDVKELMI
jgi:2-methylcitrate dehydratase PrpD